MLKKETIAPEHLKATFSAAALFCILFTVSTYFCMEPSGLSFLLPHDLQFPEFLHIFFAFMDNQQFFSFTNTAQHSFTLFLAQIGY